MYEEKIEEILSELTLEEKIKMCHGAGLFRTDGIKEKNIPALRMSDGPMGVRNEFPDDSWVPIGNTDDYVTYLPCNMALASTWNTELAYEEGEVLGEEARGRGKDVILAPGINIIRSPLCGRNFEYMSEDPFLISKIAVPYIRGVQENNDVAACVKHFAVNNQETERLNVEVEVDERTLREIYLSGFESVVKHGHVKTIMPAYNKLYGNYCCDSEFLLKDILRKEWNFDGVVISDWGAVHDTKGACEAGTDIEMNVTNNFNEYYFANPLIKAVKNGEIEESVIDDKIRNILRLMFKLNAFSNKRKKGSYNTLEHRRKALKVARESIVLLKNDNKLLPLNQEKIKTVAVIGENANIAHSNGGGSAQIKSLYEITPLLGLKMKLGGNTEVKWAKGYSASSEENEKLFKEAISVAKNSDVVIFVGGLKHTEEDLKLEDNAIDVSKDREVKHRIDSEGYDRSDMDLPYNQDDLINELLKVNKNTVVVISAGAPTKMSTWVNNASTVVQTWYNGMEGGTALAEVLLGEVNPSGKLPVTFPKDIKDCPAHKIGEFPGDKIVKYSEGIFVGYRYYSTYKIKPQFPFGYGLSYTKFKYSDLNVSIEENKNDLCIKVKFNLTNIGDVSGAEICELYVSDKESSVDRPVIELKGFEKVYLEPNETKEIEMQLDKKSLAFYSVDEKSWVVESGEFSILLGSSSEDIKLKNNINIESNYKFK